MKLSTEHQPQQRLGFIDLARSIAILMMLQGHFIDLSLDRSTVDQSSYFYGLWDFARGLTAPLFFTVTGLVFVYLLTKARPQHTGINKRRVKKGLIRAAELLFWGYALQLNLSEWSLYLEGVFNDWVFAFHVLQCIGIGILVLIIGYVGLYRHIRQLILFYMVSGSVVLGLYFIFIGLEQPSLFTDQLPITLSNMIQGEYAVFPLIPWLGYMLLGGGLGGYLSQTNREQLFGQHYLWWIGMGIGLNIASWLLCTTLNTLAASAIDYMDYSWLYARFGQVMILIGLLMTLEPYIKQKHLLLRIGQNTFPIYVIHVMLLYNGLTGIGWRALLQDQLSPLWAIIGAALFILLLTAIIPVLEYWDKVKNK